MMPEQAVPERLKSNGGHDASRSADPSRVRTSMQASALQQEVSALLAAQGRPSKY